ncbi:uncharacterized protein LOC112541269, partial [Python bivittatus]|uniref:Uncharacterized protein LOC112541269 n=1 Tax=Python bivittatus TaxID=176946 RepID=A0A9F5J334_PYTBI
QQWKKRNCTRGAFNVIATTGSMKLQKRTNLTHKFSDSGGRFWEELSINLDHSTNFSKYLGHQSANFSVTDLIEELKIEDLNSLPLSAAWLPSTESHNDIDMEPTNDLQTANESFHTEMMINLPQRYSRTSELSKGLGTFTDAAGLISDHSLLMDVEFSESTGLSSNPVVTPLPQPLLAGSDGDIVMHDETMIRKSKGMPILERVGETLRQKKLRATQA